MKRVLWALVGMLACGVAWADGQMIRWDRMEASFLQADESGCVGDICPGRVRTVGGGRVMINLNTGFLSFKVEGLSNAAQFPNGVLGSMTEQANFIGTVVCDSTARYGFFAFVDTPPIVLAQGSGAFEGFVDLPEGCKQRPEETVFLVRHYNPGSAIDGLYVAYGAGRRIR
jgi:hypothetical protein